MEPSSQTPRPAPEAIKNQRDTGAVLTRLSVLLALWLLWNSIAQADASPCQGWGKATFVYEADTVETCLDADPDVNAGVNRAGKTPLIGAVQLGDSDAVWLLLAAGANPNKQDRKGWTPLMFAAQAGHQDIVRQLAKAGADPNIRNEDGKTALLLAIEQEQTAVLGPLEAAGAPINAATLLWIIEQGQHTLIPFLAAAGVNLDVRFTGGGTLLMMAAQQGQRAVVEQLITAGLDPNRETENGETALIRAAEAGHRDLVEYLLRFQTDNGAGALFWAVGMGRSGAVEQFLAAGVDSNTGISWEWADHCTPLYRAVIEGQARIVRELLTAGADPNSLCGKDQTALMGAAEGADPGIVEQLIAAGADVNSQNDHGDTALMMSANAAIYGNIVREGVLIDTDEHFVIVEHLIAANADLTIRDKRGKTVLENAEEALSSATYDYNTGYSDWALEWMRNAKAVIQVLRAATPKTRKGGW